jgi:hypothetical protein
MLHVEADAETVAGMVFGRRPDCEQRQEEAGQDRASPCITNVKWHCGFSVFRFSLLFEHDLV